MRLISLIVRNYRLHQDRTLEFDPARTLIGGDNETGKSTLAEAIHRALFLRAKTGGKIQKAMRSDVHAGHPEVTLVLEQNEEIWTIEKRFSGTSGTTRLSSATGSSFQGDEAEEKLAAILRNSDGTARSQGDLDSRWSHLWVWQGKAGDDAGALAGQQKDQLARRLQSEGLAAVLQSDLDQQVRETIQADHSEIFTKTKKIAADSKLSASGKFLEQAREDLAKATAQSAALDQAVTDHRRATETLATSEEEIPATRAALTTAREDLAKATELAARLKTETEALEAAGKSRSELVDIDKKITNLLTEATAAAAALTPLEAKLAVLTDQENEASRAARKSQTALTESTARARAARLLADFAAAAVSHFEKAKTTTEFQAKAAEIETFRKDLTSYQSSLAEFPEITAASLTKLRKLDSAVREAETTLAAIATGIELLCSDLEIRLDGETLASETPRVITDPTELHIGPDTRILINPGGGNSLKDARGNFTKSRAELQSALEKLTVSSLDEAAEIQTKRQTLGQKIETTQARLEALGSVEIAERLSEAIHAREAALADLNRRHQALTESREIPENLPSARAAHRTASTALETALQAEKFAIRTNEDLQATLTGATEARQAHQHSIEVSRQKYSELKIQASTLAESYGQASERQQAIAEAAARIEALGTTATATSEALAKLDPETLANDRTRHERKLKILDEAVIEAGKTIAVCRATLTLDGSHDPEAEVQRAKANLARAEETHAIETRRADAIALLETLFSESQSAIRKQITAPIEERINSYLASLHGSGTRADLVFTETGGQELTLTRPGQPTFPFETLSGGTKEQLAAAVRLAMAEILAADHGGILPILFDDAFAFADPGRTKSLQRMLDLAASRGLQIIILSCNPADYSPLAAKEIRL